MFPSRYSELTGCCLSFFFFGVKIPNYSISFSQTQHNPRHMLTPKFNMWKNQENGLNTQNLACTPLGHVLPASKNEINC